MALKIMRRKILVICVVLVAQCLAESKLDTNRNPNSEVIKQPTVDNKDTRTISERISSNSNSFEVNRKSISASTESPSFMSRVASWFFPFGKDSQAESSGPIPQHAAPRIHGNYDQQENCNPCNEVPWIPLNNQPVKTVIEFVPPSQNYGGHGDANVQTQVITANGILSPPAENYGAPLPPPIDNIEVISTHLNVPKDNYGPPFQNLPLESNNYHQPKDTYGAPAQNIPSIQNNLVINTKDVQNNFGPPPETYGPPQPLPDPSIQVNHVTSSASSGPLENTYGAPNLNYRPPVELSGNYQLPKQTFRPPKSAHIPSSHNRPSLNPPNVIYGSPNIPPTTLKLSNIHGGTQSLSLSYGIPYQKPGSHFSVPLKATGQQSLHSNKPTILTSQSQKFNGQSSYKLLQSLPSQKPSAPFNGFSSGKDSYSLPPRKPNSQGGLYAPQFLGDYLGPPPSGHGLNNLNPLPIKSNRPVHKNPYTQNKGNLGPLIKYGTPMVFGGFSASHFGSSILGSNKYVPPTNPEKLNHAQFNKYIPVQHSILVPPPQHSGAHFSIPPTTAYLPAPSIENHLSVSTQLSKPQHLLHQDNTKTVTPTSEEYRPPPQQLPISTNQAEIPQETSIVHIPIYDNSAQFLQPPLAPIPFPELNPGPIPPIHHAQPFYVDHLPPPGKNEDQGQHITTIEIHESENGNLQYLTNIPNPSKLTPPADVQITQSHELEHNHNLIKHVLNALPEKINTPEGDITSHNHLHQDTSISETKQSALQHIEDSILVPPPQTPNVYHNEVLPPLSLYQGNNAPHQQHHSQQNQQLFDIHNLPRPQNSHIFNNDALTTEVKVVKSIPIAEFTSSIEYPATIAQAPLVDIIAEKDVDPNIDLDSNDNLKVRHNEISSSKDYEGGLSKNPIVVDDDGTSLNEPYSAASSHNISLHSNNYLEHNEQAFGSDSKYEDGLKSTRNTKVESTEGENNDEHPNHNYDIISSSELEFKNEKNGSAHKSAKEFNFLNLENQTQFTPPTIDYSSWLPSSGPLSTSMIPPAPNAGGVWVSPEPTKTIPETVPEGMKPPPPPGQNPKKIQIIIPYTSNSHPTPFQQPGDAPHHTASANWIQEQQAFLNGQVKMPENTDPGIFMTPPSDIPLIWLTNTQNGGLQNHQDNQYFPSKQNGIDDSVSVPFDILRLQQNIDEWTIQEYADQIQHSSNQQETIKASTVGQLIPSKKIPNEYLTTTAVTNDLNSDVASTEVPHFQKVYFDHEAAGSIQHSIHTNLHNVTVIGDLNNTLFESNLIISDNVAPQTTTVDNFESTVTDESSTKETILPETTWETTTDPSFYDDDYEMETNSKSSSTTPIWEKARISISPLTRERIYVVTPQPWNPDEATPASAWSHSTKNASSNEIIDSNEDSFSFVSPRFLVRPTPASSSKDKNNIKIIYSEWPQSINNLETTTVSSTTGKSTKSGRISTNKDKNNDKNRTPSLYKALWGLMDLTPYTPPPDGMVETHSGHSKVATQVTQSSFLRTQTTTDRPYHNVTSTTVASVLDLFQ